MLHVDRQVVVQLVGVTLLDHVVRTVLVAHQFGQHGVRIYVLVLVEEIVVVEHTVPYAGRHDGILQIEIDRLIGGDARHDLRAVR